MFFHLKSEHKNYVVQSFLKLIIVIKHFFYTNGGQLVPVALKLFEAKSLTQIFYGAQAGIYLKKQPQEIVQTKFL